MVKIEDIDSPAVGTFYDVPCAEMRKPKGDAIKYLKSQKS